MSAFESVITRDQWREWPARVEPATSKLLDLFAQHGIKATFFTLGWVAENHPGVVRRIIDDGHELACHGLQHTRVHQQNPDEFRADITRAKDLLEDVAGCAVHGYRAASFSIDERNLWAFQEIEQAGFRYSSSIYPVHHDLYGMPNAPRTPFRAPETHALCEIPVSTVRLMGRNIPAGGGGYFRLLPYFLSRALIRRVNRNDGANANMYFHPWEFDPEQPRPEGIPLKSRFRHYLNQSRSLARLDQLLHDFKWGPFCFVYANEIAAGGRQLQ